jgi:hypothetical protein
MTKSPSTPAPEKLPPVKVATRWPVQDLRFDPQNPRFTEDREFDRTDPAAVIRAMIERDELTELIQSIATSGYIDIEPFIVVHEDTELRVLEGNRRLAALLAVGDVGLAKKAGVTIPELTPEVRATLKEVTVYRVATRADATAFIGFKHINGPRMWDSLAKAKYAAQWFKRDASSGITLKEISERMGDRHDTIRRMVLGVFVLEQAAHHDLFHIEDRYTKRAFPFSHLYTALPKPSVREYLGLAPDWKAQDPAPNPVPSTNLTKLREFLSWLFGSSSSDVKPVIVSQNPDLNILSDVLANPRARVQLEKTRDLIRAQREIVPSGAVFEQSMVLALNSLRDAASRIGVIEEVNESLLDTSRESKQTATSIYEILNSKKS